MRSFYACLKKERMELVRTGRLTILLIVYTLFGIMNPAIAKLTPWLMKTLSGSLEATGLIVTEITVDALTSWEQFYKNIPMALIILVLILCGTFTAEYQRGTLIPILTRGLSRYKIVASKELTLISLWTLCYWLCYLITYIYTAWFWDNGIASNLLFAGTAYWLFGIWVLSLLTLFSTLTKTGANVLLGTGAAVLAAYLLGLLPPFKNYVPTKLMSAGALLKAYSQLPDAAGSGPRPSGSIVSSADYLPSVCVALALTALSTAAAMIIFNRRRTQ